MFETSDVKSYQLKYVFYEADLTLGVAFVESARDCIKLFGLTIIYCFWFLLQYFIYVNNLIYIAYIKKQFFCSLLP